MIKSLNLRIAKMGFLNTSIGKSFQILTSSDRIKLAGVVAIQLVLAILDLIGVAIVGILGALAVSGVQGQMPGDRVSFVLKLVHVTATGLCNFNLPY